ncbi:MAG: electron transport complex subunit RsxC [Spirochaetales bacterium]|nr:electron transport complex subunit RsxC [Spirochaetales bacterium]
MSTKTFRGGAHPPERKERSAELPIERVEQVKQVVIPVNQHFGAPIQALVKVGDTVKRGQKIADSDGRMTCPVHASVAGTVKKIEPRMQPNNVEGLCVVIEPDGSGATEFMSPLDGFACTKEEALARIHEAGIVGMGGAGFPTWVKLAPPPNKPIDVVIANAAECEPYLTIDERVLIENPGDFVEGMAIVMRLLGVKRGVIGLEENKKHCVDGLEKAIAERARGAGIEIVLLKTKYPQGGEKMLIVAVTGKEVPSGGLPMDVGAVVQNVGTFVAVCEAFRDGKPLIERGFTASGGALAEAKNLYVPIGTVVADLVPEVLKVIEPKVRKVVAGGPMMGVPVPHWTFPIQKNTSGVLFLDASEAKAPAEDPCIRCGRCMRACSCRLSPALLNKALEAGDLDLAREIGVLDCIECGTCSFVCPAHIQLVQRFRVGKQLLRNKIAKEAKHAGK